MPVSILQMRLPLLLLAVTAAYPMLLPVAATGAPKLEQLRSDNGQIVVESPDIQLSGAVLATATDTRKALAALLGLPPTGNSYLYVRVLPTEPGKDWPLPAFGAILRGNQLDFSIVLHVPGPRAPEEFIRAMTQFCLYEKILSNNDSFHVGQTLPQLPLWLSEGVMQVFLSEVDAGWSKRWLVRPEWPLVMPDASYRDWARVVTRAKAIHKAPTLQTILGWNDLSDDSVERLWQQAFSYYLVTSLTKPGEPRDAFQKWLITSDSTGDSLRLPASLMADEFAWRSQLERSIDRSRDLIFSWDVSREELDRAMPITIPASGKQDEITTTIDALGPYKKHPSLPAAIQDKVAQLTEIQARSSLLWQPTLSYYNAALLTLVNIRPPTKASPTGTSRGTKDFSADSIPAKADYNDLIALAQQSREAMEKQHTLVADYLNWVVVTKSAQEQGSTFASYYELHRKLDEFRPGGNTIRQNVLRIESASTR